VAGRSANGVRDIGLSNSFDAQRSLSLLRNGGSSQREPGLGNSAASSRLIVGGRVQRTSSPGLAGSPVARDRLSISNRGSRTSPGRAATESRSAGPRNGTRDRTGAPRTPRVGDRFLAGQSRPSRITGSRPNRPSRAIGGASASVSHGNTGYRSAGHRHKKHYRYGSGPYTGFNYYSPFFDHVHERHCAFFYPAPVSYAYVPFGFYGDTEPAYVTDSEEVQDDYGTPRYEPVEVEDATSDLPLGLSDSESTNDPSQPAIRNESERVDAGREDRAGDTAAEGTAAEGIGADERAVEPLVELEPMDDIAPDPAAGGPVTEKFLREASESFAHGDYVTAAEKFRLASVSAPQLASPLFALGQSLIAVESDDYAARVLRRALDLAPELVKQTGDVAGVYRSPQEFDRIMAELRARAQETKPGSDSRFVLGIQEYFSGDARARSTFAEHLKARPADDLAKMMKAATDERFGAAALPPIEKERAQTSVD
jgi:hypothetical protein